MAGLLGVDRDDLQCLVVDMRYDFRTRCGELVMADGDCCDMAGCIALFKLIDPEVRLIRTFSGAQPDTVYRRSGPHWHPEQPSGGGYGRTGSYRTPYRIVNP